MFEACAEQLEFFTVTDGVTDIKKKQAFLLTNLPTETYQLAKDLMPPFCYENSLTYDTIVEPLQKKIKPLKSTIAARYEFGKCICAHACAVISKSQSIRSFLLLPRIGDIFAKLVEKKHFSKLDLRQSYHQVEVTEESNNYLIITTHQGLFKYKRLVFDVTSNPPIWKRAIDLARSPSSMI